MKVRIIDPDRPDDYRQYSSDGHIIIVLDLESKKEILGLQANLKILVEDDKEEGSVYRSPNDLDEQTKQTLIARCKRADPIYLEKNCPTYIDNMLRSLLENHNRKEMINNE